MTGRRLEGAVAVVTGGGRGIGKAISLALAAEGARVAVLGQKRAALDETVSDIAETGGEAMAVTANVALRADMERAFEEVAAAFGPVTTLVSNAGVQGPNGPIWQNDPDDWWQAMEINMKGPLLGMTCVLPAMLEQGRGCIINMGSYIGINPMGAASAYATSKAALMRLTDSAAESLQGTGVSVFCISPGYVRTDMTRDIEEDRQKHDPNFEPMPEDWTFPPERAAGLCVRLATGVADKLTGRMIHVRDDLDAMIAEADRIIAEDRYALRLTVDLD